MKPCSRGPIRKECRLSKKHIPRFVAWMKRFHKLIKERDEKHYGRKLSLLLPLVLFSGCSGPDQWKFATGGLCVLAFIGLCYAAWQSSKK